jgi:hypothetical protein
MVINNSQIQRENDFQGHLSCTFHDHLSRTFQSHLSCTFQGHLSRTFQSHLSRTFQGHLSRTFQSNLSRTFKINFPALLYARLCLFPKIDGVCRMTSTPSRHHTFHFPRKTEESLHLRPPVCIDRHVYVCLCIHVCMYICRYEEQSLSTSSRLCVYVRLSMYICMYVCMNKRVSPPPPAFVYMYACLLSRAMLTYMHT